MRKLTPAMREIVRRLRLGHLLRWYTVRDGGERAYWVMGGGDAVAASALKGLEARGLIYYGGSAFVGLAAVAKADREALYAEKQVLIPSAKRWPDEPRWTRAEWSDVREVVRLVSRVENPAEAWMSETHREIAITRAGP